MTGDPAVAVVARHGSRCGMDYDDAMAMMEKRRAAWLQQDVEAYVSLFSEDFAFSDGVEQVRGRVAWEQVIRANNERSSPISWEFHDVAVHGSNILAEWTVTIEPKGTGATLSLHGMSISAARDGVFTSHHEYRWPIEPQDAPAA